MKAYSIDLRERIVKSVKHGASKAEAARGFDVSYKTVQRYCKAEEGGSLAPKPHGGGRRKAFSSERLEREVAGNRDLTLEAYAERLGVSHVAVWRRLRQLGITLKKNSCSTPGATRSSGGSSSGSSGR